MKIKSGDVVSIRHYSGTSPFKSVVFEIEENFITVKFTKDFAIFNLFEGDPIVLTFEAGGNVYNASCSLYEVNTRQGSIRLKIENVEEVGEKRKSERYAVSLYSDVRQKGFSRKDTATVRNMSSEGIMICTKANFELEQDLELDLYLDKMLVFVMAQVIWKLHGKHGLEYGLKTVYPNIHSKNLIKRHLESLSKEQDDFIRDLKGL